MPVHSNMVYFHFFVFFFYFIILINSKLSKVISVQVHLSYGTYYKLIFVVNYDRAFGKRVLNIDSSLHYINADGQCRGNLENATF